MYFFLDNNNLEEQRVNVVVGITKMIQDNAKR